MILAGIDIGTNTLRLLIVETGARTFREITSDRRITRLGQNLDRTGRLSPESEERTISALFDFQKSIQCEGVTHYAAIGTSALRNASNSPDFIALVKKVCNLNIRVITGDEEARLTLLGVTRSLEGHTRCLGSEHASALVLDIGGGSTELILTGPDGAMNTVSLPLGAVYLTERFIHHDPPRAGEVALLRQTVRNELDRTEGMINPGLTKIFIGTAGTITTLAAIDQGMAEYDPARINGVVLERDFVDDIVVKLGSLALEDRKAIRGLEPGREDIILAGAMVTQEIMQRFRHTSMLVSDWGLREGIVLDLFEKLGRAE